MLAFSLRMYRLGVADLTFDESASAFISGKPYGEMLAYLRQAFHELPPAYYLVLRAWSLVAGRSEYALRFPSVWFGVLSVTLIYRIGRQRVGRVAAVAAAILLIVQPFHLHYSQDARPYALMVLEGLLLFELFQCLRDGRRWYWWLAFGLLAVISVLTHYVMAFILVAINLYALLAFSFQISNLSAILPHPHPHPHPQDAARDASGGNDRSRRTSLQPPTSDLQFLICWFGIQVLVGGLFGVYLFSSKAARNLRREFQGFTIQSVIERLEPAWEMVEDLMWGVQAHPWPWWSDAVIALVVLGLILSLLWWRRRWQWGRWLLPVYLLVPLALVVASPERLNARYAAAIIPAYCLLLGVVIAWLGQRHWLVGAVALGVLAIANLEAWRINLTILKSDYGRVICYLNAHLQPGDAVIFNGPWQWVQQLYYPVDPEAPVYWLPPEPLPLDPVTTRQRLEEIASQFNRAWVLPAAIEETDPEHFVTGWLNEHAYYSGSYRELMWYAFDRAARPEVVHTVEADFEDVFRLQQVVFSRTSVHPGEPLLVSLPLRVLNPPGSSLMIGLRLVDRDGGVWTSLALHPGDVFNPPGSWQAGDTLVARRGVVVPPGAPPGNYSLQVSAFFHPSESSLWPGVPDAGGSLGHIPLPTPYVEVGEVQVRPCTDCSSTPALQLPAKDVPWMPSCGSGVEGIAEALASAGDADMIPLNVTFGDVLTLAGVQLAGREFWQGHFVAFKLLWWPERAMDEDYRLHIALVDRSGGVVASVKVGPVAEWYPTSQWPPGQWVMDQQAIMVPPRQPPGDYTLRIRVLGADDQPLPLKGTRTEDILGLFQRTTLLSGTAMNVSRVTVRARERTFRAGEISHPLSVTLGDPPSVRLLGYDWDCPEPSLERAEGCNRRNGAPRPGQDVRLVLYWQALREPDTSYTVFTHIIGPGEKLAGQRDSWPHDGDYPTHFWMKGEVVRDEYLIPFSPQAEPGEYRLQVGMYIAATGERLLAVQDGQPVLNNTVVLERFEVQAGDE